MAIMRKYLFAFILLLALVLPILAADPYDGYIAPSLSGAEPLTVTFTDISYGIPTTYNWTRHDILTAGATPISFSTSASPGSITFYRGNWSIQLTTTNAYGTNITPANTSFVNVTGAASPPVANFTGTPLTGYAELLVTFTDTSTGSPTSWEWSFQPTARPDLGWTSFASAQNPTYALPYVNNLGIDPGLINIRLVASNSAGSNTTVKYGYILTSEVPLGAPVANYTPRGTLHLASYTWNIAFENNTIVQFNDTSTGGAATNWNWSFQKADGSLLYSSLQNPSVEFNTTTFGESDRVITFNVSNSGGYSKALGHFSVHRPPVLPYAQYYATNTATTVSRLMYPGSTDTLAVSNGQTVTFTDASLNNPDTWTWEINAGNGTTYTYHTKNAEMKYTDALSGAYPVTLTVSNTDGSSSISSNVISITDYTAPDPVSGITNSTGLTTIQWNWTQAADVAGVRIWKNGALYENVTTPGTLWEGLTASTGYQIATKTYDLAGNLGTFVNATASTASTSINWSVPGDYYWICPENVTSVTMKIGGPGGSGKGGQSLTSAGGGGFAGEHFTYTNIPVTPGVSYLIHLGTPGANASYNADSNAGTDTTALGKIAKGGAGGLTLTAVGSGGPTKGGDGQAGIWSTIRLALNGTQSDAYDFGVSGIGYTAGGGGGSHDTTAPEDTQGSHGANGFVEIILPGYATNNVPDFSANTVSANPSSLIRFTDASTIVDTAGLTYNWSFGDGGYSSTTGSTSHVYVYSGVYDVSLSLTTTNGTITETKTEYIQIYTQENTLNTYTPWLVRIRITDAFGIPLPGAQIAVSYISTSLPNTNASFLQKAFGVDQTVAAAMASGSMAMSANTTDDGSTTFLMFPVISYGLTITNATAGLNNYKTLTPRDQDYIIRCPLADQHAPNDTLTQVTTSRNLFYKLNDTYYNLSMIYQDASGNTQNLKFQVYDYTAGNLLVYNHDLGNPGTAIVTDNYTVVLPLGQEYRWGYNSTKI
jgi:PKD repeat protein